METTEKMQLTWFEPRHCWKKKVHGKVLYFHGAYEDALAQYHKLEPVVTSHAGEYISLLIQRYRLGEISANHVQQTSIFIKEFAKAVPEVNEQSIMQYRSIICEYGYSVYTIAQRLKIAKGYINWLWRMRYLAELPRNLTEFARCRKPAPTPIPIPLEDLERTWGICDARMKLWILLALNCGYGSRDIASLEPRDLQDERLIRKRPKTGVESNHVLWQSTAKLLKELGGLPLKTREGKSLWGRSITADGRMQPRDAIKCAWWRLMRKLGMKWSFYQLRKLGASIIEEIDPTATEAYLSHSMNGLKRHYTRPAQSRLDAALKAAGELFTSRLRIP